MNHLLSQFSHRGEVNGYTGSGGKIERVAGNTHGLVAHPFEIIIDFNGRGQKPEVKGNGLQFGKEPYAFIVNVHFIPSVDVHIVTHPTLL